LSEHLQRQVVELQLFSGDQLHVVQSEENTASR
jgi:hypothetical protein